MNNIIGIIIGAIIAYLLGSINSSILVGKLLSGIDIREHGSGNAGATNTLRTMGKGAAVIVLFGDVLKGILGVLAGKYLGGDMGMLWAGAGGILGHNYPLYFGFKGGKGILTSAAVIMMIHWQIGLTVLAIALGIMAVSKYVSLGSIIGCVLYPVIVFFTDGRLAYVIFAIFLGGLAIYRHKANIRRLMDGTESKLGSKASGRK